MKNQTIVKGFSHEYMTVNNTLYNRREALEWASILRLGEEDRKTIADSLVSGASKLTKRIRRHE